MPQDVTCPKCNCVFPVTQARHAVGVQCTSCEAELTVEFKNRPAPIEPGVPPYDVVVRVGRPVSLGNANLPPPAPKKKRRDEDEEEANETKGGGGSTAIVLFAGLGAFIFALCGLGTTGYFLFTNLDTSDATINKISTVNNNSGGVRPNNNPPGVSGISGMPNGVTGFPGMPSGTSGFPGMPNGNPAANNAKFDLRPVSGAIPAIKPPSIDLTEPKAITLPGRVGAVAIGGAGRYIVMHFPDLGNLAVFDANTAKINLLQQADFGEAKLAAGLSQAVILANNGTMLRVYSLPDLKKQFDSITMGRINSIAMGSRTNGPLIGIGPSGGISLMEIDSGGFKAIEEARKDNLGLHNGLIRAMPDGRCYLTFDNFENSRIRAAVEENREWKKYELGQMTPFPGQDGLLYGRGVVCDRNGNEQSVSGAGDSSGSWYVPAVCGSSGAFLKVAVTPGVGKKRMTVSVHSNRNSDVPANGTTPFVGLPEFEGLLESRGNNAVVAKNKPLDQHLFLFPEAKMLVTISADNNKLFLRKVDLN